MRWNCMSKALRFLQITAEHQECPFFTVLLTTKSLSQNISITLVQISPKLNEHRGCYWRKKLPWMISEEQSPVPRYTVASKIGNSVISSLWQLRRCCNPNHNKFSSSSNTTVVAIFPKLCLWRRSLCSNLGGIGPEKLYRATLSFRMTVDVACLKAYKNINPWKTMYCSRSPSWAPDCSETWINFYRVNKFQAGKTNRKSPIQCSTCVPELRLLRNRMCINDCCITCMCIHVITVTSDGHWTQHQGLRGHIPFSSCTMHISQYNTGVWTDREKNPPIQLKECHWPRIGGGLLRRSQ